MIAFCALLHSYFDDILQRGDTLKKLHINFVLRFPERTKLLVFLFFYRRKTYSLKKCTEKSFVPPKSFQSFGIKCARNNIQVYTRTIVTRRSRFFSFQSWNPVRLIEHEHAVEHISIFRSWPKPNSEPFSFKFSFNNHATPR